MQTSSEKTRLAAGSSSSASRRLGFGARPANPWPAPSEQRVFGENHSVFGFGSGSGSTGFGSGSGNTGFGSGSGNTGFGSGSGNTGFGSGTGTFGSRSTGRGFGEFNATLRADRPQNSAVKETKRNDSFFSNDSSARLGTMKSQNKRRDPRRTNRRAKIVEVPVTEPCSCEKLWGLPAAGAVKKTNDHNNNHLNNKIENDKVHQQEQEKKLAEDKSLSETARTRDNYYSGYSYGADESLLTEKMNNSLRVSETAKAPRGLTKERPELAKVWEAVTPAEITPKKALTLPEKKKTGVLTPIIRVKESSPLTNTPLSLNSTPDKSDRLVIETRRTEIRAGEVFLEETNVISFPKNLPPNVHVLTGVFAPSRTLEII